ncbi:amidohydrolase family protein [Halocynthiibacter sp. C4]|uniref:amidohydrolase family protein n=1 Tax=Halocynthiibacter sp. C4 TaxID=2992758 RepID=UPI00237AC681|nr:amidohydrolase family protein [Halocynthiibacter sp. C4]MDE0589003.1 amidohydrolase family protein [Halocynthiibacter sp. C4]
MPYQGTSFLDGIELVDAHHHFWELDRFPYKWLAPNSGPGRFGSKATLQRDYLPETYLAEFGDLPLSASVHVQANCGADDPVDETAWIQHLSDTTGWPTAIVAEVDPLDATAQNQIVRHAAHTALRGIRASVTWDKARRWRNAIRPDVMSAPEFRQTLTTLEDRNLCLEIVIVPEQFSELIDLAQAHPDLKIVVNHFGTLEPEQPDNAATWRAGITRLRDISNVYCKLSGLWTVALDWSPEVLTPFVDHLVSTIGADRVMYGSNLPVEAVNCSLKKQFTQLAEILRNRRQAEIELIFSGTARKVYRL